MRQKFLAPAPVSRASYPWFPDQIHRGEDTRSFLLILADQPQEFDLNNLIAQKVFIAEVNLTNVITRQNDRHTGNAPEKLPHIIRDLAIVVDKDVPASKIVETALKADKQNIANCKIFDVYMSDSLGKDKKSIALTLSIRQGEKPLSENEIAPIVNKVLEAETKILNAKLR